MADLSTSFILEVVDQVSRPIRRIQQALLNLSRRSGFDRLSDSARRFGGAVGDSLNRLKGIGLWMGGAALAGGVAFKRFFVDTAAQFERFRTVLETLEGSSDGANRAMGWISEFASTTPYELDQVTDSFVRLRSYGLDPTNGLLRTLGDTAAAMNKPLEASVEAMADAVNGEYERLKEFGITSSTSGDQTQFSYINAAGEQASKTVDNRNKAMIQSTLEAIWSERYGGAMDKLSATWDGMMSNLGDQWTRFANMVMASGVFDWMKERLGELLERINEMGESGELQKLATLVGTRIVNAFKAMYKAAKEIWAVLKQVGGVISWLAERVGGFGNLVIGLGALLSIGFVVSIGQAILALGSLSLTLLTTPVGWFLLAVAAIAGAAWWIYDNWDGISAWFSDRWTDIKTAFNGGIGEISRLLLNWSPVGLIYGGIVALLESMGVDVPDRFETLGGLIIDGLWAGLKSLWASVTGWVEGRITALGELFGNFSLSEIGDEWIEGLSTGLQSAWTSITGWVEGRITALGELFSGFSLSETAGQWIEGLSTGLQSAWTSVTGWVEGRITALGELFSEFSLSEIAGQWIKGLSTGLQSAWTSVTGWVGERITALGELFSDVSLSEIGGAWVDSLSAGIEAQWNGLTSWLSAKLEELVGWLPDWAKEGLGITTPQAKAAEATTAATGAAAAAATATPALGPPVTASGRNELVLPSESARPQSVAVDLNMTISGEGRATVKESRIRGGHLGLNVDSGMLGMMP